MQTRVLAIKKIIVKLMGHGGQRVANCTHCKNSLPCLEVPPNQLVKSYESPAKSSRYSWWWAIERPSCWFGFFLKRPTYVYFKKGKEGTVERKWLFGDLFSLQKRGGLDIWMKMKLSMLKNSLKFAEDGLLHFWKCWSFSVKKVYFF